MANGILLIEILIMRTKPNDIFLSYSKFKGELINEFEQDLRSKETVESTRRLHGSKEHCLFSLEDKYYLLTYIFDLHNIDVIESIRKGKFPIEKIDVKRFIWQNPQLMFYRYILLKDQERKYNIGYFTEKLRLMIKILVDLNIFFLDTYILCKAMDMIFNWNQLEQKTRPNTRPLRIGFNNILMVEHKAGKLHLIINENGLRDFDVYNTGKLNLGLYSEEDLLYCRKVSVPNFNQDVREAIVRGEISENKKFKWSVLLPNPNADRTLYKDISQWMNMIGFTSNNLKNKI